LRYIEDETVRKVIFIMLGKKVPGLDGIGVSVICLLWNRIPLG
jgi:hypothetical protein